MYKDKAKFLAQKTKPTSLMLGLQGLSAQCDHDMMVYILRSLYEEVFKAKERKENKQQLQRRIIKFEKDCLLPGYLSAISVEQLLSELEDAQYFYPIRKREVTLPVFH